MPIRLAPRSRPVPIFQRLLACALSISAAGLAAALLLWALGAPPAFAAPARRPSQTVILVTTTIQAALDAAQPGDTVLVPAGHYTESLTLSQPVSLTGVSSATVIIHALTGQRVLTVTGPAPSHNVLISGLTFVGGDAPLGGGLLITGGAAPLLHSLHITGNTAQDAGGGVYADGSLEIVGGDFALNQCTDFACHGGGLYAAGDLSVTGTRFLGNLSWVTGGGVHAGGAARINQARFEANRAQGGGLGGGGLYAAGSAAITATDFISNSADLFSGGAVYAVQALTLTASYFERNRASTSGGAVYAEQSLTVTATQFLTHSALLNGGAVYAAGAASLTSSRLENSLCIHSSCQGGALFAAHTLALAYTDLISSSAGSDGGGARVALTATVLGGRIELNTCSAACFGGGLSVGGGAVVSGVQFLLNAADLSGGGLSVIGTASLAAARFEGNQAETGAALYVASTAEVHASEFISNTSHGNFGALHAGGGLALSGSLFESNQCQAFGCAGGGGVVFGPAIVTATDFLSNTAAGWGGGLAATGGLSLDGGRFQGNTAGDLGGGLYAHGDLSLARSSFVANTASDGGGLYHNFGAAGLVNALFAGNTAANQGAGLYLNAPVTVEVIHTTFAAPGGPLAGAAVHVATGTLLITNSLIASYTVGLDLAPGALAAEDYNLYSGVVITTLGSVVHGPHSLLGPAAFVAPAAHDYRLRAASAARDAALDLGLAFDHEADPRPLGAAPDIGFDEYAPPIAQPDAYAAPADQPLVILAPGLLANDTLPPGGALAVLVAPPLSGTLSLAPNGAFTYTPALNHNAVLTFTYHLADAPLASAPAIVTLTLNAVNHPLFLPFIAKQ